jgi:redox-sensing transcriptional repressor
MQRRMSTESRQASGESPEARNIPQAVIKRLSLYSRVLQALEMQNIEKISSAELGRQLGFNSAQVRKDLAFFGQFGVPGFGYYVEDLRINLRHILGKDRTVRVILLGVGNLGSALISYGGFTKQGFAMLRGFDIDPDRARERAHTDVPIVSTTQLEQEVGSMDVDIAVLAVPASQAQEMADRLVALGIKAILNFVPVRLNTPPDVHVRYVDLALELESLSYYVR